LERVERLPDARRMVLPSQIVIRRPRLSSSSAGRTLDRRRRGYERIGQLQAGGIDPFLPIPARETLEFFEPTEEFRYW
jgi:hypothetical protein